jgi:tripartite-type tricarboxylate transporter receptor subunit TctC
LGHTSAAGIWGTAVVTPDAVAKATAASCELRNNRIIGVDFRVPNVMEVNSSLSAKTVPEPIAYAKANPVKINMASPGNGTACGTIQNGDLIRCESSPLPWRSGYEASAWFGIGAPKATPVEIVDKLNKEISFGLSDPKIKAGPTDLGGTVLSLSPSDFGKLITRKPRNEPR